MKSILKIFATLSLLFLVNGLNAQTPIHYYDPMPNADLPTDAPDWMHQLKLTDVNVFKMDKLFEDYLNHTQGAREKKNGTKPIVNFYRRWRKAYEPYIQNDGTIKLPTVKAHNSYVKYLNKEKKRQQQRIITANTRQWTVVGPLKTYHHSKKQLFPDQANVYRMDISKTNPHTIYCGTETGRVFKSTDKGESWNVCSIMHYFGGAILSIAIDPTDENHLYVGTQSYLWESYDGGNTWVRPQGWQDFKGRIDAIAIDPTNAKNILFGVGYNRRNTTEITPRGFVYRTTNGGKTLTPIIEGRGMDVMFNPQHPNEAYALVKNRDGKITHFYKSTNSGATFSTIALPDNAIVAGRMSVYQDQIAALITTNTSGTPSRHLKGIPSILRSQDRGQSWTKHTAYFISDDLKGGQGYYDMAIAINENQPNEIFYGLISAYRYDFAQQQGTVIGVYDYNLHVDIQQAKYVHNELWVCHDGGINRTTDFFHTPTNTYVHTNGIFSSEYWGFDQAWNEDIIVGGRFHNGDALIAPELYGKYSIALGGGESPTGYVLMSNPRKILFSDTYNYLLPNKKEQSFETNTFTFPTSNLPSESRKFPTLLKFHPHYANCMLIGKGQYLYISTDDGATINYLNVFNSEIRDYDFHPSDPNIIYLMVGGENKFYKSTDRGKTFLTTNLPTAMNSFFYQLSVNPANGEDLWVTTKGYGTGRIWRSTDGGNTWQQMNDTSLPSQYSSAQWLVATGDKYNGVYALMNDVYHPPFGDESWVKSSVWYYNDQQQRWTNQSDGLPHIYASRMLPYYAGEKLRLATQDGIWQYPLDPSVARVTARPILLNIGVPQVPQTTDTLYLDSYSVIRHKDAQWQWHITPTPRYISDKNTRNPKIVPAKKGWHTVSLTATDSDNHTDTKTVEKMFYWDRASVSTDLTDIDNPWKSRLVRSMVQINQPISLHLSDLEGSVIIRLFSSSGTLLYQKSPISKDIATIPTNGLEKGMYLYQITAGSHPIQVGKVWVY